MSRRNLITLAVLWIAGAGTAFVIAFGHRATDDYAGWIPATVMLQLPAMFALATADEGQRLGRGRACVVAIPAAVFAAIAGFLTIGELTQQVWGEFLDLRPFLFTFAAALAILLASAGWFLRALLLRAHPAGARHVLAIVSLAGIAALIVSAISLRHWSRVGPYLIFVAVPLAWTLPLWLATLRRHEPIPSARVLDDTAK